MATELPKYYLHLGELGSACEKGVLVLTYHKIATPRLSLGGSGALLYVGRRFFARQLHELKLAGFKDARLDDALKAEIGWRRVVLTFDDGFENVHRNALVPMAQSGFHGITYLVANLLGKQNLWERPLGCTPERLMDKVQIREWLAAGHEIGAHTLTHPHLTQLPAQNAREEITASKKLLEDLFGIPIRHFCYPYGDHNETICGMVEEAGYETATTTKPGINNSDSPRFALRRFMARYPKTELAEWYRYFRFIMTTDSPT